METLLKKLFLAFLIGFAINSFAQKNGDNRVEILKLVSQADNFVYDKPSQSLDLASEAFKLAKTLKDDSLIALTLNRLGSAYWSLGNEIQALEKILESLQIAETKGFEHIMARNYGNLGNVYSSAGLDLDAIGYYRLELAIQEKLYTPFRLFAINNNIGKSFIDIGFYDSAHYYLNKAYNYLDDSFIHLHSVFYFNLAETFFKQNKLEKADSLLQLTFSNANEYNSTRGLVRANQLLAELLRVRKDYRKALDHAKIATQLANESRAKELIYICNKTLSNCYADLKQFDKAYYHNSLYEAYQDSVQNVSTVNELELLNYYQRLFRMRVLEEKNTLNKKLAEQRKFTIYSLIGILIVVLFLLSVIGRRGRKIRKQARRLEELDAFKNKIFAIVSHDLRSPIQSVSSAIKLFHEKLISKEDIAVHLPDIQTKTSRLLDLLNNIFRWAEGQMSGEDLKKEHFSLVEVIENLESELHERLESKKIKLEYDHRLALNLYANPGIVRIVLRNLVVNAIKFSHKSTIISINAYGEEDYKIIEVKDQGVGMSLNVLKGLFSMDVGSSIGTDGEKGNGLGLALCYDFMRNLGGKIEAESTEGIGSTFRVIFTDQDGQQ